MPFPTNLYRNLSLRGASLAPSASVSSLLINLFDDNLFIFFTGFLLSRLTVSNESRTDAIIFETSRQTETEHMFAIVKNEGLINRRNVNAQKSKQLPRVNRRENKKRNLTSHLSAAVVQKMTVRDERLNINYVRQTRGGGRRDGYASAHPRATTFDFQKFDREREKGQERERDEASN